MPKAGVLLLLFLGLRAFAMAGTPSVFDFPLKASDKPVLEKSFAVLSGHKVTRGHFKQTKTIARISRTFVSEGAFVIAEGNGILWETEKPFPSTLIISADKIVQRTPQGRNSVLDASENAAFRQFSDMIQAVFSGRAASLYAQFNVYFERQGSQWHLGLIPKEASVRGAVASLELTGDQTLRRVVIRQANDDVTLYEFSGHQFREVLDSEEMDAFGRS